MTQTETPVDDPESEDAEAQETEVEEEAVPLSSPARIALLIGAVLSLGLLGGLPILIVVLAIVFMIFMHELGHYLTARAAGMKVTEFFIGFGPRLWSFRRGETEYGLKGIPAGAYVKIIGMTNLDEVDPADEARTYRQKSYWRRMSVAVAGSAMHFAMALLLFFVIFVGFGRPDAENWVISELSDPAELEASLGADERFIASMQDAVDAGEVPASLAGLQPGDTIISGEGVEFATFDDLATFVRERPGETVTFVVEDSQGDERTVETTIGGIANTELEATVGFLGVSPERPLSTLGPVDAAGESFGTFGETVSQSIGALGRFFSPSGISGFIDNAFTADEPASEPSGVAPSGPAVDESDENRLISIYGAARLGAEATEQGVVQLFAFMALLNIFIGVFNLVPLLPLDGGHVAVATYERIREIGRGRRYHADITKLLPLTYAVVFVLVTIGMIALYVDITDPVTIQ